MSSLFDLLDRIYLKLGRASGRELRVRALLAARALQSPARARPPAGRVLVVTPHPDDEAIGCGGTLLLIPDRRERVAVALLTGGEEGRSDWAPEATAAARRAEMARGLERLGLERLHLLPGADGRLGEQPGLVTALRRVLQTERPAAIFLPWFMDAHPDHAQANRLLLEAARGVLPDATPLWAYEVWSPCPANVAVEITAVAEAKAAAIAAHASQDSLMRYSEAVLGLNRYRAMQVNWEADPGRTHAEAFVRMPLGRYRELALRWFETIGAAAAEEKGKA